MIKKIDISIVIVNYNVRDFLVRCVESINANNSRLSVEIIIVDNASIDGSIGAIKQKFPEINIIANTENIGFAKANNQGIQQAQGKFILILNPDTLLAEDTLLVCFEHLKKNESTGAIGAYMVDGSGKYLPESKRGLPTLWSSFTKFAGLYKIFPKSAAFNQYYLGQLSPEKETDIEVLTGAFMFSRTNLLQQLGGFDERFFMYGEDIDLSKRILDTGFKIQYLPQARIVHFKGESTKKTSIKYHKSFYKAMSIYAEKHLPHSRLFVGFLNVVIGLLGIFSFLKSLFTSLIKPLLGLGIATGSYILAHKIWGQLYFSDIGYYGQKNIAITSITSALIIVTAVWFFGWYDKFPKKKYLYTGILVSGIAILMVYAVVPVAYRNSRAVIFLGLFITLLAFSLVRFLIQLISKSASDEKNILLVANENRSKELREILSHQSMNHIIGTLSPNENEESSSFINHVGNLSDVITTLKPDEVIFDAASMKMTKILDLMSFPSSDINYKIAGIESDAIVGSNSSKKRGEIYTVESTYNLGKPLYRRLKRMLDVLLSMVLIFIFPFKRPLSFKTLVETLMGKRTFVAYYSSDYASQLPPLQQGNFTTKYFIGELFNGNFVDSTEKADICYAKYYHPVQDLRIVLSNLK